MQVSCVAFLIQHVRVPDDIVQQGTAGWQRRSLRVTEDWELIVYANDRATYGDGSFGEDSSR